MEQKVKHRVIGIIIVVAALVAIALPLLFTGSEPAKMKPLSDVAQTQPLPTTETTPAVVTATASVSTSTNSTPIAPVDTKPLPVAMPSAVPTTAEAPQSIETKTVPVTHKVSAASTQSVAKPGLKLVKPIVAKKQSINARSEHLAWVVQMGSFKSKENARHLTDRLRAAGFKAFIYTAKSALHNSIRVYVGPEYKQASISALSNKLAQKTKIQGVILSYKPLVL